MDSGTKQRSQSKHFFAVIIFSIVIIIGVVFLFFFTVKYNFKITDKTKTDPRWKNFTEELQSNWNTFKQNINENTKLKPSKSE